MSSHSQSAERRTHRHQWQRPRQTGTAGPLARQPINVFSPDIQQSVPCGSVTHPAQGPKGSYPEGLEVAGLQQVSEVQNLSDWSFFLLEEEALRADGCGSRVLDQTSPSTSFYSLQHEL